MYNRTIYRYRAKNNLALYFLEKSEKNVFFVLTSIKYRSIIIGRKIKR